MNELNELLALVRCDKNIAEQTAVLDKFLSISDEQIEDLINCFRQEEAGIALKYIGFPRLEKFIPALVEVLQDLNRPAAWHISELIVNNGEIFTAAIKEVLSGNNTAWKTNIILIIHNWQKEILYHLKVELIAIACGWTDDRSDALRVLIDRGLLDKNEFQDLLINREEIISTSINIIEDEYNWENLDYLITCLLEIKDRIRRRLNSYLFINIAGMSFYSNENFSRSKNLLNRFLVHLDKENLDKDNLIEIAGVWACENTVNLGNENIKALRLLSEKNLADKAEIKEVIKRNRASYQKLKDICDTHLAELDKLEKDLE